MVQIKKYEQQVGVAAGGLGPRASGAFEAPGKALAGFGAKVDQVTFDFLQNQKNAETRREKDEYFTSTSQEADDYVRNDKSTDTETFQANFKRDIVDKKIDQIDARTDLSKGQKDEIKRSLSSTFLSFQFKGENEAFRKGRAIQTDASKAKITEMISQASNVPETHPDRRRLEAEIDLELRNNLIDGIRTGYDSASIAQGFEAIDYEKKIMAAANPAELDQIEADLPNSRLQFTTKQQIKKNIKGRKKELRVLVYDASVGGLASLEVNPGDQDQLIQKVRDGELIEGVNRKGERVTVDTSSLKKTEREQLISAYVNPKFKDMADLKTQNTMDDINDSEDRFAASQAAFTPEYQEANSISNEEAENAILQSVDSSVDDTARKIDSGKFNPADMMAALAENRKMLESDISPYGALSGREGVVGNDASTLLDKIVKYENEIKKQVNEAAQLGTLSDGFRAKVLPRMDQSGVSEPKMQAAIKAGLTNPQTGNPYPMGHQLDLLEANNATYKMFKQSLGQGSAIGLAGGFKTKDINVPDQVKGDATEQTEGFDIVAKNFQLYQAMKRYPRVLTNHTTEDDRAFYDAVNDRLGYESLETAINNVAAAKRMKIDVKPKMKQVSEKVDQIEGSASDASWFTGLFTDKPTKVMNGAYVTAELKKRTEQRIALGSTPTDALTSAVEDMKRTHAFVHGLFVKMDQSMPADFGAVADMAVNDALKNHPYLKDEGIEKDELSIIQYGDPKTFALVSNGAQPVEDKNARVILYTSEQLNTLMDADATMKSQQIIANQNQAMQNRQNAMLGYEGFATPDDMQLIQDGKGINDGLTLNQWLDAALQTTANDFDEVPDIVQQSSMFRMQSEEARMFGGGTR